MEEAAAGSAHIDIPVGKTCLYTCAERAVENDKSDRVFTDTHARTLAGPTGFELLDQFHGLYNSTRKAPINASVVIRTCFFDDYVRSACQVHGVRQVVIVAAGMDTRVFRLGLDENHVVFELDFKQVLQYKADRIHHAEGEVKPTCKYIPLGVDLTVPGWDERLIEAGYVKGEKSIWIIEGLLVYLRDEDIHSLLDKISQLACDGSFLCGDWMNAAYLSSEITAPFRGVFASFGSPFINGSDAIPAIFEGHGFEVGLKMLGEEGANHGNRVPDNQVLLAKKFPISDGRFNFIPRHLMFYGSKREKNAEKETQKEENVKEEERTSRHQVVVGEGEVERVVREVVGQFLHPSSSASLDKDDDLFSLGIGSLEAIEIASLLRERIPNIPSLSLGLLFTFNTIARLSAELNRLLQ